MKWAIKNDERIKAYPKQRAICPLCDEEVISKCGSIKVWHWSHKKDFVCDSFGEPETLWHLEWKNYFDDECQEVVIGKHRADILTKDGFVIEVQNSPISSKQILERKIFYKNMVWIINSETIGKNINLRPKENYYTFRWKHPPKSWWFAKKKIYVDFGNVLFLIKKLYSNIPCGGWGILIKKEDFINARK